MTKWAMCALALLTTEVVAFALNPSLDISQYAHNSWKIRDGFSKGIIYAIAQTPDGYLWLGTDFGLLRFDGVRDTAWQPPRDQYLPSSQIRSLLCGRDGTLWIGTEKGLSSWKDGKVVQYPRLAGLTIFALVQDHEGTIWVGASAAPTAVLCAIERNVVQCYGEDGTFGQGWAHFFLYEDTRNNLWAGTRKGLWQWRPGPPKFYPFASEPNGIQGLAEADDGSILFGTNMGVMRLAGGKAERHILRTTSQQFLALRLLRDRDGCLWIAASGRGLLHAHRGKTDLFAQSDGLAGDSISTIFEDQEGSIWVANSGGLDQFHDLAVATITAKQGLSNAALGSVVAARDGSIWVSTADGLNQVNSERVSVVRTVRDKRNGKRRTKVAAALFQDSRGRIWASMPSGIGYLKNDRFVFVTDIQGSVRCFAEHAGGLWVADDLGLVRLLEGRRIERTYWTDLGHKDYAAVITADPKQGGLWIGYQLGGVDYLKNGRVRASYDIAGGLGSGRIDDLRMDADGALWVATQGGLSRIRNGRIATLTSKDGLPCDAVHWTLAGDDQALWLDTACGLVRIARPELDFWLAALEKLSAKRATLKNEDGSQRTIHTTVLDNSDGVISHADRGIFNPQAAKSSDGKLWFLPWGGVGVLDTRHIPFNKIPPSVRVEQFTADRKTFDTATEQHIPALTRDVAIEYTALSFVAPEKNRFKYKLEGYDRDWIDAGNRRQAFYTNLPPRDYTFRVKASNNSDVWNEAGASLSFSIDPAYYQTGWFRALCAAFSIALFYALYRYRVHQIEREFNVRLEERTRERTRLARDLHDTLLQSFHGLMLRLQAVNKLLPEGKAKDQLERTLERADQAIAEGRSAVYELRSCAITTNDLAEAVNAVGNELSADNDAVFGLVVEGSPRDLHPIVRDEFYRISREALRNAFKHAHARHIEAELSYGDRVFRLRIRDDGEGIPAEILKQGRPEHYGLPTIREQAKQVGAELAIWSRAGTGTEMELSIAGSTAYSRPPKRSRLPLFREKV